MKVCWANLWVGEDGKLRKMQGPDQDRNWNKSTTRGEQEWSKLNIWNSILNYMAITLIMTTKQCSHNQTIPQSHQVLWWGAQSTGHLICLCRRQTGALESPLVWKLNGTVHVHTDHPKSLPYTTNCSIFWHRCFRFNSLCCSTGLWQHPWDQLLKGI